MKPLLQRQKKVQKIDAADSLKECGIYGDIPDAD